MPIDTAERVAPASVQISTVAEHWPQVWSNLLVYSVAASWNKPRGTTGSEPEKKIIRRFMICASRAGQLAIIAGIGTAAFCVPRTFSLPNSGSRSML
jgi:hypothetical protein